MNRIKALLDGAAGVDDYRVTRTQTASYELFFVHEKLETVRATDTVTSEATVYVDHDGKKGDSSFSVYRSMSDGEINAKIAAAVSRARLVSNEPYQLPADETLTERLPTDLDRYDPKDLAQRIADAVFAADREEGGSINALEIFLYRDTVRVINSRGIDKTQIRHRVMIEAIPTYTDASGSVELYEDYRFTSFDAEKLTAEIREKMKQVRDRAKAEKPPVPLKINVLLRPQEIWSMAEELAYDVNYATVYSHANLHKIGDDLQEGRTGDPLTVEMKGVLPGSELSAWFDGDGAALHDAVIIENGTVKASFGASRFGQYLGVDHPTGDLRCVRVAPGTLTGENVRKEPYLECVSLSGLQLDLYNDYIGGEIRLAYWYDGSVVRPVTGITMSAKLSQVLSSLRLSTDVCQYGGYEGPRLALLRGVDVL